MNTLSKLSQSPLQVLLDKIRALAGSEREKGAAFETLCIRYLEKEPEYHNLYKTVQSWADWVETHDGEWGLTATDKGIDLVATTYDGVFHAIQCKFYASDHRVSKADIDSFISASGHKAFSERILIDTTLKPWGANAEEMLKNQRVPVTRINLANLEASAIDWSRYQITQPEAAPLKAKHEPRPHQKQAIEAVIAGLQTQDRGKLIMACGTGKTFTALKIAEQQVGKGGNVLFLVPSLALLSQTLTEWSQQSQVSITAFAVCSDSEVGKKRISATAEDDDQIYMALYELAYPATTNAMALAKNYSSRGRARPDNMRVIFATYHSIAVIEAAQKSHGLPEFDLVICDEAHRTTGQTWADDKQSQEESHFVRIHDEDVIKAQKRLYMTATPRIYSAEDQKKADSSKEMLLYSMDDPAIFGQTLHTLNFSSAVEQELLVPYKVIVLTVEEKIISDRMQDLLNRGDNSLNMDDAAKIVGCFKALAKQGLQDLSENMEPMRRAVAFCQIIDRERNMHGNKNNKVAARQIADMFQAVVEEYQNTASEEEREDFPTAFNLHCEADYVHGGMRAQEKTAKLDWLKQETEAKKPTCRILTNVRCLSEGVDVPALDAVLFLSPRKSQVEVVQAVGRVMRRAVGKQRGYIILPVVIPSNKKPYQALNDNKTYKTVWQVLKALKSHDDEFDRFINRIELLGSDTQKIEIVAVSGLTARRKKQLEQKATGSGDSRSIGEPEQPRQPKPEQLTFEMGELERAILAKVVQKMADRDHWQDWASDIARIAQIHIDHIGRILNDPQKHTARAAFDNFTTQLHFHINNTISHADIIEMLAQHLITKPVFDALFGSSDFTRNNPIAQALQNVTNVLLADVAMDKERQSLTSFYEDVRKRSSGIDDPLARQKLIITLYDTFFATAFPRIVQKHGIVYTPVELVDFILHSVAHLLNRHFGKNFVDENVQILDPFTGTGTFLVRLIQSGLIPTNHLPEVYNNQLHANEILLLPYYIAAVNIESALQQICPQLPYTPFPGILLADSFNIPTEKTSNLFENKNDALAANNARRKRQMESKITVILGNPPYSAGQRRQNDNNQNVAYPELDRRIEQTYVAGTKATNKNALYDSYIRAIRWASDRIDNKTGGIIGFVTNAGWLDSAAANGLRKCLTQEFSSLYVFNLRGDIRSNIGNKTNAGIEGGNVFGQGSTTGIAISILVKQPNHDEGKAGQIHFCDIGDYLSTKQKLEKIVEFGSIAGIEKQGLWQQITPDKHGDWLNQRAGDFDQFLPMGDKKHKNKPENTGIFVNYSRGIASGRDVWCNNPSKIALLENVAGMVETYETERQIVNQNKSHQLEMDPAKISWTRALLADVRRDKKLIFNQIAAVPSLYRPFTKGWLYYDRRLNEMVYQMPQIFRLPVSPDQEMAQNKSQNSLFAVQPAAADEDHDNRLICVSSIGGKSFSVLMTDQIPDLNVLEAGAQCFPLYIYDKAGKRREAITDATLAAFREKYPKLGEEVTKEAIFYYIYGILHQESYREIFAHNLTKELPRIPFAATSQDFQAFVEAGRQLADLHVGFENVDMYEDVTIEIHKKECQTLDNLKPQDFTVEKMKYGKMSDNPKQKDLSVIHYNHAITIGNIPLSAYEYVVNGRTAIDWVVDRQSVRIDKASGLVSDANDYALETMNNPRYPLELLLRNITLSLKTLDIVRGLPKLVFEAG